MYLLDFNTSSYATLPNIRSYIHAESKIARRIHLTSTRTALLTHGHATNLFKSKNTVH